MVDLDDAIVARLESHGERFEILLDPRAMDLIKQGKDVDLAEYLAVDDVFRDARKGTRPEASKIRDAFDTESPAEIARHIIQKGDVQMTAQQRKELLEAKYKRIVTYIATNAIDPRTRLPHPPKRIEIALEKGRFRVDPMKPFCKEVEEAVKSLRPLLPIRFEKGRIAIKIKADDYGRCYNELCKYGIVDREEWTDDGFWIGVMEIPAGLIAEITDKLKQRTKGNATVKPLAA